MYRLFYKQNRYSLLDGRLYYNTVCIYVYILCFAFIIHLNTSPSAP